MELYNHTICFIYHIARKIEAKKTHIMYIRTQTVSYIQTTKNVPKHQFRTKQPIRRRRSRQQQKY